MAAQEFKVIEWPVEGDASAERLEATLTVAGTNGWELVATVPTATGALFVMSKPRSNRSRLVN